MKLASPPIGEAVLLEKMMKRPHPMHRLEFRPDRLDHVSFLKEQSRESGWIEEVEVAREVIATPIPSFEKSKIETAGAGRLEDRSAAGSQKVEDTPYVSPRVFDVFNDLNQKNQVKRMGQSSRSSS